MVIWLPADPCKLTVVLKFSGAERREVVDLHLRLGAEETTIQIVPNQKDVQLTVLPPRQPWIELWVEQTSGPPLAAADVSLCLPTLSPLVA
jgi:hypothetical protein